MEWNHAGISKIKKHDDSFEIRIPDKLFDEENILSVDKPVFWSFEKIVDVVIISNKELTDDEYEFVGKNKLRSDGFRCTIPKAFFSEKEGQGSRKVTYTVPEKVYMETGERRHFMYHKEMIEAEKKSCYVFNDTQFNERFEDSDVWNGRLDQVPKFF